MTDRTTQGEVSPTDDGSTHNATRLDSCTTITESGHYVLTQDIEDSSASVCINIQASDVHFDGGGHTIAGEMSRREIQLFARESGDLHRFNGVGVNVNQSGFVSNVTVTNLTTTNWFLGVFLFQVIEGTVRDVTGTSDGTAIFVANSSDTVVTASNGSNNVFVGVEVDAAVTAQSANNSVVDTTTVNNGRYGVRVERSTTSTVRNVTATDTGFNGVIFANTSDSTVQNVTTTDNGFVGIEVTAPPGAMARNNTITDTTADRNAFDGIVLNRATNTTVRNVSVVGTRGLLPADIPVEPPVRSPGIVADNASGNAFIDIDARDQAAWVYAGLHNSTNTVRNLRTDAGIISFEGRDVAVGPTATTVENASTDPNATLPGTGLTVTNLSADAFIEIRVEWRAGDQQARTEPPGNQSDAVVFDGPLVVSVGPATDPNTAFVASPVFDHHTSKYARTPTRPISARVGL